MNRILAAVIALPLVLVLSGCENFSGIRLSQDAAIAAQIELSPADVAQLRATCRAASPSLTTATAPGVPDLLSHTAVYPKAFCEQLLAGQVPLTANHTSLTWLPTVLGYVQTAARIVGMILPMVLPLL